MSFEEAKKLRLVNKYEASLREERTRQETLNNVEIEGLKTKWHAKIQLQKLKEQENFLDQQEIIDGGSDGLMVKEKELDDMRIKLEKDLDNQREALNKEYREQIIAIRRDIGNHKNREEQRIIKMYRLKLDEDVLLY